MSKRTRRATPPPDEIKRRLRRVREEIKRRGLDAMLVGSRPNTRYLSGFRGTDSLILVTARQAYFLADFRYLERARLDVRGFKIRRVDVSYNESLEETLSKQRVETIGFEGALPYDAVTAYRRAARPARLRRCDALDKARETKTPFEQRQLALAQRAAEKVWDRLLGEIAPGMTERETRRLLLALIDDARLEGPSFDPIVASGPNSSQPHATAGDRRIRRRDIVTIDFGVVREGYCSDMTRTIFFGRPSAREIEVHDVVLEAQLRALAAIEPGVKARKVDQAARDFIESRGFGQAFGHGTGHGVGVEIHEPPALSKRSKATLREGMCVTVEPGVYLEGRFGVRIEDTVIVGPDGAQNLTRTTKAPVAL